ncbi:hypothetical protein G9C98_002011 [Cotesia typhae]|uniref:Uncharacterized protein n=1 Tax=Cotesia typhae TaxID=2053667 RepID=A0A8J5QTZ1_9HYME|nr:hypothetical protein G9C98_002011 [Cotesia typhae]
MSTGQESCPIKCMQILNLPLLHLDRKKGIRCISNRLHTLCPVLRQSSSLIIGLFRNLFLQLLAKNLRSRKGSRCGNSGNRLELLVLVHLHHVP